MPHITVLLSDAQARTLRQRARAAQRPSDEILRDIVTTALDEGSEDIGDLDEEAIDQAFAEFAAAYPVLSDRLFASDPDLGTEHHDGGDADWPTESEQQDADVPLASADPVAASSDDASRAGSALTSSHIDQAFGILADQYEEIAEGLFPSEDPHSADHLESQDRHSAADKSRAHVSWFTLTK
ncbi:hypothetical protein [Candidatus Poriferisodalis sp.]|uniref:hypothetical protein n=1 Tax=Candidatus Poriferisodalis sp. TaxID=3101277 RepID=UPI003B53041A